LGLWKPCKCTNCTTLYSYQIIKHDDLKESKAKFLAAVHKGNNLVAEIPMETALDN